MKCNLALTGLLVPETMMTPLQGLWHQMSESTHHPTNGGLWKTSARVRATMMTPSPAL